MLSKKLLALTLIAVSATLSSLATSQSMSKTTCFERGKSPKESGFLYRSEVIDGNIEDTETFVSIKTEESPGGIVIFHSGNISEDKKRSLHISSNALELRFSENFVGLGENTHNASILGMHYEWTTLLTENPIDTDRIQQARGLMFLLQVVPVYDDQAGHVKHHVGRGTVITPAGHTLSFKNVICYARYRNQMTRKNFH